MSGNNELRQKIDEAKSRLPLPKLMNRLGLGEHAKKSAHCPFPAHDDEHPSFSVFKGKDGLWHYTCFSKCGDGDEIMFLSKLRGLSLTEAMSLYLDMAGFPRSCPPVSRELPGSLASPGSHECPESLVSHVSNGQCLQAELRDLAARNACTALNSARRRRFKLLRDLRALEKTIRRELTIAELTIVFDEWYRLSKGFLDPGKRRDDYWLLFLAELQKVAVPTGEGALRKALENACKFSVHELPIIPGYPNAPEICRRVAALHSELFRSSANGVYFLSYRDAAKVCDGLSQQKAHTITGALVTLGVVEIVSKGDPRPNGKASEFRYLLSQTRNGAEKEDDQGFIL